MYKKSQTIHSKYPVIYIFALIVVAFGIFYSGLMVGKVQGARSIVPEGEATVTHQGDVSGNVKEIDFRQFWEVWNLIKDTYVYQPVSEEDLYYGALQGLLGALDDPYSIYFTPEQAEDFNQELEGKFFGIGAEIGIRDEGIVVVAPLAGSPAKEAGIKSGDLIVAVDGEDTLGFTVSETVFKIRGELGIPVTLTILREGSDERMDITIVRGEIVIDSVKWEIRDDGIAVVNIFMFNDETTTLFQEAVQEILTEDVTGIVLDLRNNPGGLLSQAINIAGFWVDGQPVVIERVQGVETPFAAAGIAKLEGMPTVVLVNGGSASGSEILAGALQDFGLAHLIGEQTFGKGSVQEYYGFPDQSAVKMTVAEWLTPKGNSINEIGIEPDQIVEYTEEDYNEEKTPQFDAAIDYLTSSN